MVFYERKKNGLLLTAVSISMIALFLILSLMLGRIQADQIKSWQKNGSTATAVLYNLTDEQTETLSNASYVDYLGTEKKFGIMFKNDRKICECAVVDADMFEQMLAPAYVDVVGHYPENENEICLSTNTLKLLGIDKPEIGMQIPVYLVCDDWIVSGQSDIDENFLLSGFFTDDADYLKNFDTAYFSTAFLQNRNIGFKNHTLILSNRIWMNEDQLTDRIGTDLQLTDEQRISVINLGMTAIFKDIAGGFVLGIIGFILIILCVYMFIYNVVLISVSKEWKQYGLLKIIGATPKQLKLLIFYQTLGLILVSSGIGGSVGFLIVKYCLPRILLKMYALPVQTATLFHVFFGKALVFSMLCVSVSVIAAMTKSMWSILKPAPTEAGMEEKIVVKKSVSDREKFLFALSWRNIFLNRKKAFITISALFLCVIVSMASIMICNGLDQTNKIQTQSDFEIEITKEAVEYCLSENDGNTIAEITGSDLISQDFIGEIIEISDISKSDVTSCVGAYAGYDMDSEALYEESFNEDELYDTGVTIQPVSDAWMEQLEIYASKNRLNVDVELLKSEKGFLWLQSGSLSNESESNAEEIIGKTLTGCVLENNSKTFELTCAGILDVTKRGFPELNMPWDGMINNHIIVSESTFDAIVSNPRIYKISFDVDSSKEVQIKSQLQNLLTDVNEQADVNEMYDMTAKSTELEEEKGYIFATRFVMGTFSAILATLAIINFINTIASGIYVRKNEFLMLRQIGMTQKQLSKMLYMEGLSYVFIAMGLFTTIGSLLMFLLAKMMKHYVSYFVMFYPWQAYILFFALLIILCVGVTKFLLGRELK
jgi:putative ABC transport system permease protein